MVKPDKKKYIYTRRNSKQFTGPDTKGQDSPLTQRHHEYLTAEQGVDGAKLCSLNYGWPSCHCKDNTLTSHFNDQIPPQPHPLPVRNAFTGKDLASAPLSPLIRADFSMSYESFMFESRCRGQIFKFEEIKGGFFLLPFLSFISFGACFNA